MLTANICGKTFIFSTNINHVGTEPNPNLEVEKIKPIPLNFWVGFGLSLRVPTKPISSQFTVSHE